MKKKENKKGITLIALVITIIIMIILVAVSVALVVKGDLFGNAQEGTEQTRKEAEKEQLTEYVYGQYKQNADGKVEVNLNEVKTILNSDKDKFKGDAKIEGDKLTVTGNSGVVYTVYKNGVIESEKEHDDSEKPYANKIYVEIKEKDGLEIYAHKFDIENNNLEFYYNATATIENNEIITCSFGNKKTYPFSEISKTSEEFSAFITEYNNGAIDKGYEQLDIADVCDICIQLNDDGDLETAYFLNDYSTLNCDGQYDSSNSSAILEAIENYV